MPEPVIVAFPHGVPDHLTKVIRGHLEEEPLVAIAEVRAKWVGRSWTHHRTTDKRLPVQARGDVERQGEINQSIDLDSIRYVR